MDDLKAGEGSRAPSEREPDEERELAAWLAEAGPRPEVPAEHLAAIRATAHAAWKQKVGEADRPLPSGSVSPSNLRHFPPTAPRRSRWPLVAALAASLLLAAGLGLWLRRAPPDPGASTVAPVVVARVLNHKGPVLHGSRALRAGEELLAGATLESDASGRASLLLASGVELRLDHGTRLTLRTSSEVELSTGAVYADTGPAHGAALAVVTALGTARDIGTRFLVALPDTGTLQVRVRDGAVEVAQAGGAHHASGGEELTLHEKGEPERRALPAFGPDWNWVRDAAPSFVTESRTLGAMLDWAARETGWTIRFESPELAAAKAGVRFQGRAELRPDRSILAFLPSFGLEGELEAETLTLRERR